MIRSLNTGVGGIRNFQTSLDVIANNLANLNTVGFKGGRTDFAKRLRRPLNHQHLMARIKVEVHLSKWQMA